MCLSPNVPAPPPPPPPPPDPVQKTADKIHQDPAQAMAQDLAARLGTSQLTIPLRGVNVPG
jgi:hypothetical protein